MTSQSDIYMNIDVLLKKAETPLTDECCIFKVPFGIRRHNPNAYTPTTVSIGPFHHNRHPRFQEMEKHKRMRCNLFLEETQTSKDTWIRYIEEAEPKIRGCYSDILEFTKEELVNIIFVDSGFILDSFTRLENGFHLKPWLEHFILTDLLLLENQLPFFVLDDLYNLSGSATPSFLELTFEFFLFFNKSKLNYDNVSSIKHFTDLIRTFHLNHSFERQSPRTKLGESLKYFPTATKLSEAGVSFKVNTQKDCLLDLDFLGGVLEIPQLEVIDDWTELLFRNMMALEQCLYPTEQYITDYAKFWDLLINTNNDVDMLVRKGVLVNWLGDTDSVAKLFNGLLQNITEYNSNSRYLRVCQDLNFFCKNPWNNLKSTFKRDYCKTPWQTTATIAGFILLVLSFIQTVCSILQVIQQ